MTVEYLKHSGELEAAVLHLELEQLRLYVKLDAVCGLVVRYDGVQAGRDTGECEATLVVGHDVTDRHQILDVQPRGREARQS